MTQLQYNWNRWYTPDLGRWMSQDPIGFAGGDGNLYRYVLNAPTIFVDPTGLDIWLLHNDNIGPADHTAMLIGDETNGYEYFSFTPDTRDGEPIPCPKGLKGKLQRVEFNNFDEANKFIREQGYDKFIRWHATAEQDAKAVAFATEWDEGVSWFPTNWKYGGGGNYYKLYLHSCIQLVTGAIDASDLDVDNRPVWTPEEAFDRNKDKGDESGDVEHMRPARSWWWWG